MLWSTLLGMTNRTAITKFSAPTRKIPRCSSQAQDFFQRNCKIRVFSRILKSLNELGNTTTDVVSQDDARQQKSSAFQNRQRFQSPKHSSRNRSMESQNQPTVSPANPQVIYQPSGDPRGIPKLNVTEISEDPSVLPEWAGLFDVIVHQKRLRRSSMWRLASLVRQKVQFLDLITAHRHIIKPGTFSAKMFAYRESLLYFNSRRYRHILQSDTMNPVALFDFQT